MTANRQSQWSILCGAKAHAYGNQRVQCQHCKCVKEGNRNEMSDTAEKPAPATGNEGEKKLKPCCACPETKKVRDAW